MSGVFYVPCAYCGHVRFFEKADEVEDVCAECKRRYARNKDEEGEY